MDELVVERLEGIEVWTLNRPQAKNAISRALAKALQDNLARVNADKALRVVVITGAGDAFCAGADLKERAGMSEEDVRAFLTGLRKALRDIEKSDRVFIAAVNGAALGGGTEMTLACDLRVASATAKMGLTETSLAIIPGGGGTQRLPRLVGPGRAKDLVFTARRVGAEEALRLGLVDRVAPEGRSARDEALQLAAQIARNGPLALAAAKHAIDEGLEVGLDDALLLEHRHYERTLQSKDRLEGIAAFIEKREPRFQGE